MRQSRERPGQTSLAPSRRPSHRWAVRRLLGTQMALLRGRCGLRSLGLKQRSLPWARGEEGANLLPHAPPPPSRQSPRLPSSFTKIAIQKNNLATQDNTKEGRNDKKDQLFKRHSILFHKCFLHQQLKLATPDNTKEGIRNDLLFDREIDTKNSNSPPRHHQRRIIRKNKTLQSPFPTSFREIDTSNSNLQLRHLPKEAKAERLKTLSSAFHSLLQRD